MKKQPKNILLAIAILAASCNGPDNKTPGVNTAITASTGDLSRFISKDSADKMISSYINSLGDATDTSLYSVSVDAAKLKAYLLSDSTITGIKISLGHTLEYINSGGKNINPGFNYSALTLIISAFDQAGNYLFFDANTVLDFARPCPNNCPNGEAGSPYFTGSTLP
jgi:hypothetical protein